MIWSFVLFFFFISFDARSAGLVNYCVPAGEAHLKALEIARNINEKV